MEEILSKANELGRLLKNTEIFKTYDLLAGTFNADENAVKILDEYMRISSDIKNRQDIGDTIEKFEIENAKNLATIIAGNELIMKYLKAQQDYMQLLLKIQNEISNKEADFYTNS